MNYKPKIIEILFKQFTIYILYLYKLVNNFIINISNLLKYIMKVILSKNSGSYN